jgi:putative nucleotidyltransferase with HDIG domain
MAQKASLLERIGLLLESGDLELPVYNPVALRLQEVVATHADDVSAIEELIIKDQALAAEVLRAANSPFYCGLMPVGTIRNAIIRLGAQQILRLVILVSEHAKYKAQDKVLNSMLGELWRHASVSAMAAQWLAKRLHLSGSEEVCFLGGLLHDIGKLVILRAIDEIKQSDGEQLSLSHDFLKEILTTTHCQLGYKLLKNWNVPDVYCHIAQAHHDQEIAPSELPLAVVRLANETSNKLSIGLHPNPAMVLSSTQGAALLKTSDVLLAELEVMIEDHLFPAGDPALV